MASEKKEDKKVIELIKGIESKEETVSIKAIKAIKVHGSEKVIEPLVKKLASNPSEKVERAIEDVMMSLKSSSALNEIIRLIEKKDYAVIHAKMLSFIWNSGYNPIDKLEKFVEWSIKGDFLVTLECYTIIENMEGEFEEESIMNSLVMISEYLSNNDAKDEKGELIKSIALKLKEWDNHLG